MKLYAHGFRGNLPIFVYNFLQDRKFSVKLPGNVMSDVFVQENREPQSSVLSQFCFMINDILSTTPVPKILKYPLYVDDCALWYTLSNEQFSARWIQDTLDSVQHWAFLWRFKLPVPKCIGLVFTRRNAADLQLTL